MRKQISCYINQSDYRGCTYNRWLIYLFPPIIISPWFKHFKEETFTSPPDRARAGGPGLTHEATEEVCQTPEQPLGPHSGGEYFAVKMYGD